MPVKPAPRNTIARMAQPVGHPEQIALFAVAKQQPVVDRGRDKQYRRHGHAAQGHEVHRPLERRQTCLKPVLNGTINRNANITWIPVDATRSSLRSSMVFRSSRSASVSSRRPCSG